jgi:hypothetical protein
MKYIAMYQLDNRELEADSWSAAMQKALAFEVLSTTGRLLSLNIDSVNHEQYVKGVTAALTAVDDGTPFHVHAFVVADDSGDPVSVWRWTGSYYTETSRTWLSDDLLDED